jgi:hypothetical protein
MLCNVFRCPYHRQRFSSTTTSGACITVPEEVLTPRVGRNVAELIRQVQAFQLVRETKGAEATPSGWQPGRPTLKVGPDLVGKVWKVWTTDLAF